MVDRAARLILCVALGLPAACASVPPEPVSTAPPATARLLFAGDIMLGRSIAPVIETQPEAVFRHVRRIVSSADLAVANIESPLTERPHRSGNPHRIEADPASVALVAEAGFDVGSVANNHAGDAGPQSVIDSMTAIRDVGMVAIGGGPSLEVAWEPVIIDVHGIRVALLAVDVSGQGLAAEAARPGIASWDARRAQTAIAEAAAEADVIVVGIHGGVAYRTLPDPLLGPIARELVDWGADVVWGAGPHVVQPVETVDRSGDPAVMATSLGNFLFDQYTPETSRGLVLEVLVDRNGVVAHRVGTKVNDDALVRFTGWQAPTGDAVLMHGSWWALDRPAPALAAMTIPEFEIDGDVIAAGAADLDGNGTEEIVVSYRHPLRSKEGEPLPPPPTDASGRSAHLGVVSLDGTPIWLSRRPPRPVVDLAACSGTVAFAYSGLDDDGVVATGGGAWGGFGFILEDELPGGGSVACVDVDGDGRSEAAVLGRAQVSVRE